MPSLWTAVGRLRPFSCCTLSRSSSCWRSCPKPRPCNACRRQRRLRWRPTTTPPLHLARCLATPGACSASRTPRSARFPSCTRDSPGFWRRQRGGRWRTTSASWRPSRSGC
ncbi:uncharacterized protein Tco025E_00077 [Trypanosoma conorhini]|uniref:Uncharacterized protein n=1 Tax=Trypanosoma conorhini TaxID=83891 RepID=A0A3R7NVE0_9TRYP|nr:uncharacterized protein Tco025E_00077 [Trypanosoma conorhini]RNF27693.1 hypothetical protein Tco025E_00077 [Trypanosoma conorhini]